MIQGVKTVPLMRAQGLTKGGVALVIDADVHTPSSSSSSSSSLCVRGERRRLLRIYNVYNSSPGEIVFVSYINPTKTIRLQTPNNPNCCSAPLYKKNGTRNIRTTHPTLYQSGISGYGTHRIKFAPEIARLPPPALRPIQSNPLQ